MAKESATSANTTNGLSLDQILKYGRIVYRYNENAPNQIYLIPQVHTVEIDGGIVYSAEVPRIQAEIFRLASHIIESGEANLLLPEGRYLQNDYTEENAKLRDSKNAWLKVPNTATDKGLEGNLRRLLELDIHSDTLLITSHPNLDAQGAEDQEVGELLPEITEMANRGILTQQLFGHLIAYRSGYILYSSPIVIDREFSAGKIAKRCAIVMIGNGHVDQIVEYIQRGQINLSPLKIRNRQYPGLQVQLNLRELGYGVAIIKPLSIS